MLTDLWLGTIVRVHRFDVICNVLFPNTHSVYSLHTARIHGCIFLSVVEPNRFTLWGSLNFMWSMASDDDRGSARGPANAQGHENAREPCL